MIADIVKGAFDFKAIFGGFAGSAIMQGIKRGLFSNEAGVGSAPNAAASAGVSHPAKQGLVQMLSVYIDTIVICTATASVSYTHLDVYKRQEVRPTTALWSCCPSARSRRKRR